MGKKKQSISSIAVDLGANNTGVLMHDYDAGEAINSNGVRGKGFLFQMTGQIQLSQQGRTVKRHQIRGNKRRKMARRLLFVILKDKFGVKELGHNTEQFLLSMLKRRGFTFLSEELDEAKIESSDLDLVQEVYPGFFHSEDSLLNQLLSLSENLEKLSKYHDNEIFHYKLKDFKKYYKETLGDAELMVSADEFFEKTHSQISNYIQATYTALKEGHKHRREYLKNIGNDIRENWGSLTELHVKKLDAESLGNLIGHISNLQLKPLRKYFNDEKMSEGDYFNEERLGNILRKWLKSWHSEKDSEEQHNQTYMIQKIKGNESNIIKIITQESPLRTIPPYEDMNNRRIPRCQSMLLDSSMLDKNYPEWETWASRLEEAVRKNWNYSTAQESFAINSTSSGDSSLENSTVLQRILDTSIKFDPFKIRWQSYPENYSHTKEEKRQYADAKDLLEETLEKNTKPFLEFAREYYSQIAEVREGLELNEDTKVLSKCNLHTRKKSNLQYENVRGVLQIPNFKESDLEAFKADLWQRKYSGNSTIKGFCKKAEEARDRDGTLFKQTVNRVLRIKISNEKEGKTTRPTGLDDQEKEVLSLLNNIDTVVMMIAEWFQGYTEKILEQKGKKDLSELKAGHFPFGNLFSLAQLYNILEENQGGYSSTCAKCSEENNWRTTIVQLGSNLNTGAIAVRLSGDTVRPFDGVLRRLLERKAYDIANVKLEEIKASGVQDGLHIPIAIEQNRFDFMLDLGYFKKQKQGLGVARSIKTAEKRVEKLGRLEANKKDRIKNASGNRCAVTGKSIGETGEIDHIIPRSKSLDLGSTIYNSEMNLIYLSKEGNRKKGKTELDLSQLDKKYLKDQFKLQDPEKIRDYLKEKLGEIIKLKRRAFHSYDPEFQKVLRHSLFDAKLKETAIEFLGGSTMSKVNGTQAYFARRLQKFLEKGLKKQGFSDFTFNIIHVDSRDVKGKREELLATYPELSKKKDQPPGSHIIDAAMVLAAALDRKIYQDKLYTYIDTNDDSHESYRESLFQILPEEFRIEAIKSTLKYNKKDPGSASLFKEGIFGERVVPMYLNGGKLFAGFGPDDGVELEQSEEFYEMVKPYLYTENLSFSEVLEKANDGFYRIPFVRPRVVSFIWKSLKNHETDSDLFKILSGLLYTVQKQNVWDKLRDVQKKVVKDPAKVLSEKEIFIGLKIPRTSVTSRQLQCKIKYPAISDWNRLMEDPVILKASKNGKDLSDEEWDQFYQRHFPSEKNNRHHQGVRKVFSLPIISSPSGGFRVQRRDHRGRKIYQLLQADGGFIEGVYQQEGSTEINMNDVAILKKLYDSPNNVHISELKKPSGNVIKLDEWRYLNTDSFKYIHELQMALWSKPRPRIRVTLDTSNIKMKEKSKLSDKGFIYNADPDSDAELEEQIGEILNESGFKYRPRNKYGMVQIGVGFMTLDFVTENGDSELYKLFAEGTPVK